MPTSFLNLRAIESRMNQIVIDLHDAARLCHHADRGVSTSLRNLANELHEIVSSIRRLAVSTAGSGFGDLS